MFKNQTVLVTGGSRGIGKAIALGFAKNGANVAIIYAGNTDMAQETVRQIRELGVESQCYQCDASDYSAVKVCCDEVVKQFSKVDILVNNAGVTADTLMLRMSEQHWDKVLDTNLKGAFNFIKHLSPSMLKNRGGAIINISSVIGLMGNAGQVNYAASKAGLIGLTKSVAREFASRFITCNAVAPGFISSDMTAKLSDEQIQSITKNIPLARTGEGSEVADAVMFLAGAKYITGEVIKVDGGLYI